MTVLGRGMMSNLWPLSRGVQDGREPFREFASECGEANCSCWALILVLGTNSF